VLDFQTMCRDGAFAPPELHQFLAVQSGTWLTV
jgi:hypothetical protein